MKLTQALISLSIVTVAIAAPVVIEVGFNPEAYGIDSASDGPGIQRGIVEQAHAAHYMNSKAAAGQQAQQGETAGQTAHIGNMHEVNAANANQVAEMAANKATEQDANQAAYQAANQAAYQMARAQHAGNTVRAVDAVGAMKPVAIGSANQKAGEYAGAIVYSKQAKDENGMNSEMAANQAKSDQYENTMNQADWMAETGSQALANAMNSAILKRRLCSMYKAGSLSYVDCMNNVDAAQYTNAANQAGAMNEAGAMQQAEAMKQAKAMKQAHAGKTAVIKHLANDEAKADATYQTESMTRTKQPTKK